MPSAFSTLSPTSIVMTSTTLPLTSAVPFKVLGVSAVSIHSHETALPCTVTSAPVGTIVKSLALKLSTSVKIIMPLVSLVESV